MAPFFRWSHCEVDELVPPPDFIDDGPSENSDGDLQDISTEVITSTQKDGQSPDGCVDMDIVVFCLSPVFKKIRLEVKEKFSIKEAFSLLKELGNHAAASEKLLEALADRKFSGVSGEDIQEVNRRQAALVTRLWRLNQKMKDRKLQHKISKNPSLLDATFCAKEEFSFIDRLQHYNNQSESEESSQGSLLVPPAELMGQAEAVLPGKETIYRKKLTDLKDWKYILERTKTSFVAVQDEAMRQVDLS